MTHYLSSQGSAAAVLSSQASLCGICGEQSGTESGFSSSILISHQYHSTDVPFLYSIHRPSIRKPTLATDSDLTYNTIIPPVSLYTM
jgi:hypothetical protein